VSVTTDCPFLPSDLVARLQQVRIDGTAELAVAASNGQAHHVSALWNVALRGAMREALVTEDVPSMGRWAARYKTATGEGSTSPLDPFFNVNTADDIDEAERLAALDR
jgi:molybdopterin-guanine dinucleotide biosynthesis protein A